MKRSSIQTLAALGVIALTGVGCGGSAESSATPPATEERRAPVRVATVEPEPATDVVSLPADLRPRRRGELAAEVPGRIERLSVEEGDAVRRGQELLAIDRRALEQAKREAEAVFFQRTKQYERAENLFAKQSITQAQMLDALTLRDVARAALDSAELQLSKSTLEAPWSGRVSARRVELGDYVQPGQTVIELIDNQVLEVRAPVAAMDVPYVDVGAAVRVRVDALPGEVFEATIVRTGAEVDPRSRTLEVVAELPNDDGRLKPGLPARIEIVRREWSEALLLPTKAVIQLDDAEAVYVVAGDRVERRSVRLGPLLGDRVVIEEGLAAGEQVVVEGQGNISDGQAVDVQAEETAA